MFEKYAENHSLKNTVVFLTVSRHTKILGVQRSRKMENYCRVKHSTLNIFKEIKLTYETSHHLT